MRFEERDDGPARRCALRGTEPRDEGKADAAPVASRVRAAPVEAPPNAGDDGSPRGAGAGGRLRIASKAPRRATPRPGSGAVDEHRPPPTKRRLRSPPAFLPLAILPLLLLAGGCGGDGSAHAAEPPLEVNPVEAALAIDDVRVAGVPLAVAARGVATAPPPATGDEPTARPPAPGAGGPAIVRSPRLDDASPPPASPGGSAGAAPASRSRPAPLRPVARLMAGDPLAVDMEVADAPQGSEVTVVWATAEGRPVWRGLRTVGEQPRMSFVVDTSDWPAGVYVGTLAYGDQALHRFAVQVGRVPPPVRVAAGPGAGAVPPGATAAPPSPPGPAPSPPLRQPSAAAVPPPPSPPTDTGLPPALPEPAPAEPAPTPPPAEPVPPPVEPEPQPTPPAEPDHGLPPVERQPPPEEGTAPDPPPRRP